MLRALQGGFADNGPGLRCRPGWSPRLVASPCSPGLSAVRPPSPLCGLGACERAREFSGKGAAVGTHTPSLVRNRIPFSEPLSPPKLLQTAIFVFIFKMSFWVPPASDNQQNHLDILNIPPSPL